MNIFLKCAGLFLLILTLSCSIKRISEGNSANQLALEELHQLMAGEFSSADQAKNDTLFYDINLVMFPIWETDKSAKWLYVEQAVTRMIDKPYRQRVYKLTSSANNSIESKVYELPTPKTYIHGWNQPEIFNNISSQDLIEREGCSVFLKKEKNCYAGATKEKDCKSTLRGAAYATSLVSICKDAVISWDQGWSSEDSQVWGAETKGYIFNRKSGSSNLNISLS